MATSRCTPEPLPEAGAADGGESLESRILREGEFVSCLLSPRGSNYTFLSVLRDADGNELRAVYKPRKGERPLWDFESGTLYKRECAAYLLSQALGWDFIPETIIREGPHGVGSVQRFVEHEAGVFYRALRESHRAELKTIACFDIIANNADRKEVHCIKGLDGRVWGIDHGLTFNEAMTLRTVIWDFWGEDLEPEHIEPMRAFLRDVAEPAGRLKELVALLGAVEVEALSQRIGWMLEMNGFPRMQRY